MSDKELVVGGTSPFAAPAADSAQGETCTICGAPAVRKVEEVIPLEEWHPAIGHMALPRHPASAYLCAGHYNLVMFHPKYREGHGIVATPLPDDPGLASGE